MNYKKPDGDSLMEGDKQVISYFNTVLTNELTSINQFFLHARICKNWGLDELNKKSYKKSILDMKQSDQIIERILFLEGLPNLQQLGRLRIGENVQEMLAADLEFELEQRLALQQAIFCCEEAGDYVSKNLLKTLLEQEESYIDWLEEQQYLIEQTGIKNYLQSKI